MFKQEIRDSLPVLQPETITFATAHKLAGSSVDGRSLSSLDRFVSGLKTAGVFTKVKDFMPLLGSSLAGAAIKFVGSATASLPGFVEADFSLKGGLDAGTGGVSNTGKYIDVGTDMAGLGLAYNDFGGFVGLASGGIGARTASTVSAGALMANYDPAAATSTFYLHYQNGSSSYNGVTGAPALGLVTGISSLSGVGATYYRNGLQQSNTTTVSNTAAITGNLNILRLRLSSNPSYLTERVGVVIITSGLTSIESKRLQILVITYLRELGRIPDVGMYLGFGDSITQGQGGTQQNRDGYSAQLAKKLGLTHLNLGVGGSTLRPGGSSPSGFSNYTDLYEHTPSVMGIMYGTNDIGNDANASGDATIIADIATKLATVLDANQARNIRTLVLSPPWRQSASDTKLSAYIKAQADVALAAGVPFVDTYNIFLDTGVSSITTSYFPDNLHPNNAGHKLIAEHAYAALQGRIYRDALLDFPSIAGGASASLTVTMYTARAGQAVSVTLSPAITALGLQLTYWISANDTVTIQLTNPTGSAIDPPAANYKTVVWFN